MREILSILLAAFMLLQPAMNARAAGQQAASQAEGSRAAEIEQQVRAAQSGSILEVGLLNGQSLRGRLKSVGAEDFVLEPIDNQFSGDRVIRFDEAQSLVVEKPPATSPANRQRSKISKRGKIILVVGIAALLFGIVTFATTKGP
jgi:hypothetical protein